MKKSSIDTVIGFFLISLGLYFMAIGLEFVTDEQVFVELWIMSFLGLLLILVGIVLVAKMKLANKSFIASLILMCFSMIGFGIGFFGETSILQQWIFGVSSSICFLLSIVAFNGNTNNEKTK